MTTAATHWPFKTARSKRQFWRTAELGVWVFAPFIAWTTIDVLFMGELYKLIALALLQ